jgi:hypothetical protein
MKFKLTCQHPVHNTFTGQITTYEGDKLTSEFDAVELDVILENITCFLRGCGFAAEGQLQFIPYNKIDVGCGGNCGSCDCKHE